MLFKNIWMLDENFTCKSGMYVAVEGDEITFVGDYEPDGSYGRVLDGAGKLLMPGLVNAHSHSPMTLLRGYAENMALQSWLHDRVFPFEAKMNGEDIYTGAMLGYMEMLRFGITSVSDMYFYGEEMVRAVKNSGIRANVSLSISCFDDSELWDLPGFQQSEALLARLGGDNKVTIDLALHSEYTTNKKIATQMARYAREKGLNVQVHVSETKREHEECLQRHGMTPVKYLESVGLLDTRVTAAHCVHVDDADMDVLREKGVFVAANPVSNLKLASGFARVDRMLEKGVKLCLGTDGAASNNNLNLFEEMKLFAMLPKAVSGDAAVVTPSQALYAATRAGALSQDRERLGLVKEGYLADLVVLNVDRPWMYPVHSMENNLVYAAQGSDVCLTMVDGQVVYENGEYPHLNAEAVQREAQKKAMAILNRL